MKQEQENLILKLSKKLQIFLELAQIIFWDERKSL